MARKVEEDRELAEQQLPADADQKDLAVLPTPDAPQTPEVAQAPQPAQPAEGKKSKDEVLATGQLGWKKLPKLDELKVGDIRLTSYYHEALTAIYKALLVENFDGLPDFSQSDIVGLNVEGKSGKMMYQNLRTAARDVKDISRALKERGQAHHPRRNRNH